MSQFRVQTISQSYSLSDAPIGKPLGGAWKRIMDVAIAGCAVLALAPLFLIVAALIALTMGRPVLFIQNRVGFGGHTFPCLKFRTMVTDAGARLEAHLAADPEAAAEWRATQKLRNDPRVTWLGRALRKSSLDELPQLFNVLRGDMSCVGPRPITPSEVLRYGRRAADYVKVRPGLTGLWQVNGRSQTTYGRRVLLDCVYVRRVSPPADIAILLRTPLALFRFGETA
ncbi:MAG: sugar transferase [Hyphomicrobiales bacterium]|nr:sugar transferase [Hyphomicrobiales bacterium]